MRKYGKAGGAGDDQVWETCKRTDYLSKDRFTNLLKDRLKLYKSMLS